MSRIGSGDVIERQAGNNIYTVLVILAFVAALAAVAVIYMRADTVFGGLMSASGK